jgi:dephospho-CoA kinase
MIIGLTGGIACGKSTVANILRQKGILVIDADEISREITKKGKPAWQEIKEEFGEEVIGPDGEILRKKLAQIVFNNPTKLATLNQITHPRITKQLTEILAEIKAKKSQRIIVIEVPLLFECGLQDIFDEVWVVKAPQSVMIERLIKRDSLSKEDALKRISSQMPLTQKAQLADRVIENSGSVNDLKKQIEDILKELENHKC